MARPELARPVDGAVAVLERLAATYGLVAIVTGRQGAEVLALLPAFGLAVFGLYGLERRRPRESVVRALRPDMERIAAAVEGAWVEDKRQSLAIHYRAAPDPGVAAARIGKEVAELARLNGLVALPGKMVVELAPRELPGKGAVVEEEARDRALEACLYAGDDVADLEAFAALDRLREVGVAAVKVAVRSEETPASLVGAADVVVERPAGLVRLLDGLHPA